MKDFKIIRRYSHVLQRNSLRNVSTYVVLAALFFVIQYCCPEIGMYLKENGCNLNVWELYIWSMSTRQSQLIYLTGIIGVAYQAIGLHAGMDLYMIRMNRHSWLRSQVQVLFLHVLGVNLFLLCCFAIAGRGQITFAGEWSRAAFMAAQFRDVGTIGLRRIFSVSYNLLSFNPNVVGVISFLLAVLLGMVIGVTMMIFSLLRKTVFGGMVVFIIWFMDVLAVNIPALKYCQYILPIGLGRISYTTWNYGVVTPGYCVIFLAIMFLLLSWISDWVCDHVDFAKVG